MMIFLSAFIAFVMDRLSKIFILNKVFGMTEPLRERFGASVPVIQDVFNLTFHGNTGMAFGMLSGNKALLIALCLIILIGICVMIKIYKPNHILAKISIGMIIGGAIGNVFDRIIYGYVIDFLDFCLIDYPIFNVADSFIVIGAVLFCIYVLFLDKKEDKIGNN